MLKMCIYLMYINYSIFKSLWEMVTFDSFSTSLSAQMFFLQRLPEPLVVGNTLQVVSYPPCIHTLVLGGACSLVSGLRDKIWAQPCDRGLWPIVMQCAGSFCSKIFSRHCFHFPLTVFSCCKQGFLPLGSHYAWNEPGLVHSIVWSKGAKLDLPQQPVSSCPKEDFSLAKQSIFTLQNQNPQQPWLYKPIEA